MSNYLKQNVFCILPFTQVVVRTDGSMSSCCNIPGKQNIRNTDFEQFWQSQEVVNFKQNILGQDPLPECKLCYNQENVQGESMRTRSLRDYKFFSQSHYSKMFEHFNYGKKNFPKKIEWHIQNLCNLKCLTCSPRDSSAFLIENQHLKISVNNQSEYTIDDAVIEKNLKLIFDHKVDVLDLRGGESMLVPKIQNILMSLDQHQYDCTLSIQTNGTVLNHSWKTILARFKKIKIMLSVDAYGSDNYYIRYPGDWNDIESNVDYFMSQPNISVHINCTVSNLNFALLSKLVSWAGSKKLFINWSFVDYPEYFHFTNLPLEIFEEAKSTASKFVGLENLITAQNNTQNWAKFCNMIDRRDQHRKNRIFDILPALQKHWIN